MQNFRDLVLALRYLELDGSRPVMVHASLSAFGYVRGGAEAVLGALFGHFNSVVMPAFTYKTMIVPESGPPNNAVVYGSMSDSNKMAQFYHPDMPADKLIGVVAETMRRQKNAARSHHPILSFSGVNAQQFLDKQTLEAPFAPIAALADADAWVLLLGVPHSSNTSIHLGEMLAGRKTFVRWALTTDRVIECPSYPSCSDGFDVIDDYITNFVREVEVGETVVQAMPMRRLVKTARERVEAAPFFMLCDRPECPRCRAVREGLKEKAAGEQVE